MPIEAAHYPSLSGKGVLITGGGSGIGMYLVEAFCAQGARVGFIDFNAEASTRVADVCEQETGNRPQFRIADLTEIGQLKAAVAGLRESLGPLTVLVNNAGNDDRLPVEDITPEYWDERFNTNLRHQFFTAQSVLPDMAVNLKHQFFCAQAVAGDMRALGGGAIINMGSNSWMQGVATLICYTTAKSAVQGLTKCLARELGPRKIRVNSIAPGWILTDRQVTRAKKVFQDKFDDYLAKQCLKEFLLPPDTRNSAAE